MLIVWGYFNNLVYLSYNGHALKLKTSTKPSGTGKQCSSNKWHVVDYCPTTLGDFLKAIAKYIVLH